MKREIFNRIIETVKDLYRPQSDEREVKVIENEQFISYYFDMTSPDNLKAIEYCKNYFKEHGWKHEPDSEIYMKAVNGYRSRPVKTVLSILYNKEKDRISIAEFEHGYAYAYKKNRFYPFKKNHPIFCYSKQLYVFIASRRYRGPRIMKGGRIPHTYGPQILKTVLNIDYQPVLDKVLTRNFMNTKNEAEVIEKMYNVKIPKLLIEKLSIKGLDVLCKVLQNPGEMNRVCQFILEKEKKQAEETRETRISFLDGLTGGSKSKYSLGCLISEMCFGKDELSWLVEDWLNDHYELDKKLSLKITSDKRMRDEHSKLSRERILKGVKHVKMHKNYKGLFKDFAIPVEEVDSKKRLLQESIEQEHCVATYASRINNGDCGIFSMVYKDIRYTLEVGKSLRMHQLQGFRNGREGHNPPQELRDMITQHLLDYRSALGDKAPVTDFAELPF
jgi:hypothetical protein